MVLGMVLGFGFNKTKVLAAAEKFVQQGKLQNAIAEYEKIAKDDPKDLTVLNTIGDLYARLGQVDKAVACFKRVGDAYATNGFTLKAIAMYKKLTKLSPGSLECIQKLGDLYTQQGLYTDARAQLVQVADHHMRQGHLEEAANIFQKLLELDPENSAMQTRLAELYVKIGKKEEARNIYFRAAESLHQRGSVKPAEEALQKVLSLDPQNSRALSLLAQLTLSGGDAGKTIELLEKIPDLDSRAESLNTLLQAYLKAGRSADAEPIARKLFTVHNDLSGILTCAEALLQAEMTQPAIALFQDFADRLIGNDPERLIQSLDIALGRVKEDAKNLEILRNLYSRAGDTTHGPEITELLAHALVQAGELERARDLYKELADMEPDNPLHLQNYKQILAKLGEDSMAKEITPEMGAQPFVVDEIEPIETVVEQNYSEELSAALQTALTESELFDSYNVPTKAIPPLEATLPRAPYDLRINQRLASLYSRTGRYADAARACSVVKEVYKSAGHEKEAEQYGEMAARYAQKAGVAVPKTGTVSAEQISPATPAPAPPSVEVEFPESLSFETGASVAEAAPAITPEFVVAPAPPVTAEPPAAGTAHEIDLSDEWEKMISEEVAETTPTEAAPEPPAEAPRELEVTIEEEPADPVGDLVQEIKFYISQGMWAEAGTGIYKLAAIAPDEPQLKELRKAHAAGAILEDAQEAAVEVAEPRPAEESAVAQELVTEEQEAEAARRLGRNQAFVIEESEVPDAEKLIPPEIVEPAKQKPVVAKEEVPELEPEPIEESVLDVGPEPQIAKATASEEPEDLLGSFVSDLEASLGDDFTLGGGKPAAASAPAATAGSTHEIKLPPPQPRPVPAIAASADPLPARVAAQPAAVAAAVAAAPALEPTPASAFDDEATSVLSDLFAEFKEELEDKTTQEEDPDTHYNLGVAFKEMGLLDEAIGELQKVCQAVDRGVPFSQTMQAYTWLAHCFVEKNVPEASFKWYERALKLPADEETRTAIHYELACAYEVANRRQEALNHFMEVYTTNIDFRDVAERIKALKS